MTKLITNVSISTLEASIDYLLFVPYKNGKEYIIGYEEYDDATRDDYGYALLDKNIKVVSIPAKYNKKYVTAIGVYSFAYTNIESIFIPFSVKILYRSALNGCPDLKNIFFQQSNQLKEFGLYSIGVLNSLSEIIFPSSLKILPDDVFLHECPLFSKLIYCGSNDFTLSDKIFERTHTEFEIIVSKYYPSDYFGMKNVKVDDEICNTIRESTYYFHTVPYDNNNYLYNLLVVSTSIFFVINDSNP